MPDSEHSPGFDDPVTASAAQSRRLVVVSNRLPITLRRGSEGWTCEPSHGGLVRALDPVLAQRGGAWIGWAGAAREEVSDERAALLAASARRAYRLEPVPLDRREIAGFYQGFCNRVLWPLFHDLPGQCAFASKGYQQYLAVNQRFAARVAETMQTADTVLVQDYHLMALGEALRERTDRATCIVFFLHIPFPSPDMLVKLPWARAVLRSLLAFDVVGFQTERDRRNFLDCVERMLPSARVRLGPAAQVPASVSLGGRTTRVHSLPIGIDFATYARRAATPRVCGRVAELRQMFGPVAVLLGVDRLDYTKGLLQRLDAFERALELYPELRGAVSLVQLVVPSRESIPEYAELKARLEQRVGELNGRFGEPGYVPVHHYHRSVSADELVALYRTASAAFVSSLKDGMNLVCKEFCAARVDGDGVLILSEFAGAAAELAPQALTINPYDRDGTASVIARALAMDPTERAARMRALRSIVRLRDVDDWIHDLLAAAGQHEETGAPVRDQPSIAPQAR